MPSDLQLQRSTTEQSSACNLHSNMPEGALCLPVTEEHPLLLVSLIPISYDRPSSYQFQLSATEQTSKVSEEWCLLGCYAVWLL
jgi:hypothetical protein